MADKHPWEYIVDEFGYTELRDMQGARWRALRDRLAGRYLRGRGFADRVGYEVAALIHEANCGRFIEDVLRYEREHEQTG